MDNFGEAKRVARVADLQLRLFSRIADMQRNIALSLKRLVESSPPEAIDKLSETELALEAFILTPPYLMPEKKPFSDQLYNYHGAFIMHDWDVVNLIQYSILSCLSGAYSVAYAQLRVALETFLGGVVYDALARPIFRSHAKELIKIPGFQGAPSFKDLIKFLGKRDFEHSAKVLDIVVDNGIVPAASPSKLINQLKEWQLINHEESSLLHKLQKELSCYVHRMVPSYSDVGIRLERGIDWLALEPIVEEITKWLERLTIFAQVCTSLSLNVIGPTSANYAKHLKKENIKKLKEIYEDAGYIRMQNKLIELFGNL